MSNVITSPRRQQFHWTRQRGGGGQTSDRHVSPRYADRIGRYGQDHAEAQRQFLDGLNFQRDAKDAHFVPSILESLAAVLVADLRPQEAIHLLGKASALREEAGLPRMQIERAEYEQTIGRLKEQMGESGFERSWNAGNAIQADQVSSTLEKRIR